MERARRLFSGELHREENKKCEGSQSSLKERGSKKALSCTRLRLDKDKQRGGAYNKAAHKLNGFLLAVIFMWILLNIYNFPLKLNRLYKLLFQQANQYLLSKLHDMFDICEYALNV